MAEDEKKPPQSLTITPSSATLAPGETVQLTASNPKATWSSANSAVAVVGASGLVTGLAGGEAAIKAQYKGEKGSATVTVTAAIEPPAEPLTVTPGTADLYPDDTVQLTASKPGAGWASSHPDIATVDAGGLSTGKSAGDATVTATLGGESAPMRITVRNRLDPDNPPPIVEPTGNWYVSTSGSDSAAGSSAAPFRTIQKAADVVNAGETVIVRDGIYTGALGGGAVVSIARGGSSGNLVTFRSATKWGAKLSGQNYQTNHGWAVNAPYVVIQDFEMYEFGYYGGDAIDVEAAHIRITGNAIHHIGRICNDDPYGLDGILIGQRDDVTIDGNIIHDVGRLAPSELGCNPSQDYYQNADHAIYVDGGSNITISNNVFYKNARGWSVHVYPDPVSNLKILNNTFADPNPYRVGQIVLVADITTADIANNIFYDPTTAGIRYAGHPMVGVTVRNNLTFDGVVLWNDTNGTTTVPGITKSGNLDNTDPLFTNAGSRDYTLTASSPAKDAGLTLSTVTVDANGVARPQGSAYDIGAYERV